MTTYKLFLLLEKFLMILPKKIRKLFFTTLASTAYYLSSKSRRTVKQNLEFAFDNSTSDKEIKNITKYSFKNLMLNFLHLMEIRHISKAELKKKVTIENIEAIEKVHSEGRSVIYVTTHYSSWELGGTSIGAFIEPLGAVYRKMKNKNYEGWVLESRSKFGNTNLEKTNVLKPLIRLIKDKKACGILIDTSMNKREGVDVTFMGKTVSQTATPAYLARKFNAAIIPVAMRTDDEENYTLMIFDEIPVEKTEDEKADILKATQLQADWLSSLITKEPKFWFWLHRRFKGEYPQIYV
ncbi:MAG: lipid A biosynthesis lauroyl acyltransferase [Campylobacterota bacterium]|nr:lipid A biosynthesis lauroyl acyltransferase [Campylobacterota bacterium]